jgi:hypothetical protein
MTEFALFVHRSLTAQSVDELRRHCLPALNCGEVRRKSAAITWCYFGTLKIASRYLPTLIVLINVPTNILLPLVTSRYPRPPVILSPRLAFFAFIVITLGAIS